MIREVMEIDKDYIVKRIQTDHKDEDTVKDFIEANKCFVYDDDGIKGFIFTKLYDEMKNNWDLYLYVERASRNLGIGNSLYNEIVEFLHTVQPNELRIGFDKKREGVQSFIEKRGFIRWYGSNLYQYKGPKFEVYLDVVSFNDKYFDQYFKMTQDCFYQVRKDGNIKPYLIPDNKEYREYKWNKRNNNCFLLNGDEIIANYSVENNYIDDIMVSPKYQGLGYGKKIVQAAVNHVLDNGYDDVCLYCIDTNTKAINLYTSLGFTILEATQVYKINGRDL